MTKIQNRVNIQNKQVYAYFKHMTTLSYLFYYNNWAWNRSIPCSLSIYVVFCNASKYRKKSLYNNNFAQTKTYMYTY